MNWILMPPDEPLTRKMTQKQEALLRRIVATNGGGVSVYSCDWKTVEGLVKRHMVQGKSGNESRAVHTPIGLKWVRENS